MSASRSSGEVDVGQVLAHVAVAMKHHGDGLRRRREPLPAGWDDLFDLLLELARAAQRPGAATGGHSRPAPPDDRPSLDPLLLETGQAALVLGCSTRTLRRWTAAGLIEPHRQGGRVRYSTAALRRFADTKEAP